MRRSSRRQALRRKAGRKPNRFDDFYIAGAAADVAAERRADVIIARRRIVPQQTDRRHDKPGRAVAALRSELFVKAALHGGKRTAGAQPLDGFHFTIHDRVCERQAGKFWLAVHQHGTGAALAAIAAGLGAGQSCDVTQIVEQQQISGTASACR